MREGNQAGEHIQNDVYGEILLILSPLYFDERFSYLRNENYSKLFEILSMKSYEYFREKDAGLWEFRSGWQQHAFTYLMSWAGLDRYRTLIRKKKIEGDLKKVCEMCDTIQKELEDIAIDDVIYNGPEDKTPNASLLFLAILRFPNQKICEKTVQTLHEQLGIHEDNEALATFMMRYARTDDFGNPKHAFVICTYWLAEALCRIGEKDKAQHILEHSLKAANHLGLFSEHFDVDKKKQTGNFPQCYSHIGLINAAFVVSPNWNEIL